MRKIKFRAYDKARHEYLSAGHIYLSIFAGQHPADCVQYLDKLDGPNDNASRFVIEQFTGMYDKSGTEIYEGDIAQYVYVSLATNKLERGIPFEIRYNDQEACFSAWDGLTFCGLPSPCNRIQVVGNIHRNPELMKCER